MSFTKDEFLDAWEGPCVEAAEERPSNILDREALHHVYYAMTKKLLEGMERVTEVSKYSNQMERYLTITPSEPLFRLTLPKEPSDGS